jgi:hypothetical protein
MAGYFFRVEHDLLRSEAFKTLGGSAIKVYLVIGLYSDFGTDWAYPSIRTIARQAGLSRQTVMTAIEELIRVGLLTASRVKGKSTAYRLLRDPVPRERPGGRPALKGSARSPASGPNFLEVPPETGPNSLDLTGESSPNPFEVVAQEMGRGGQRPGPNQEPSSRSQDTPSIPIPGTPFRLSPEGRLLVAVDLQELLTSQGIPKGLAARLVAQKDPEAVAKVLLNAFYLQSQGKLQNGPGYIRAGIEDGYDLLPQVANRLEGQRRRLQDQLQQVASREQTAKQRADTASDEAAIAYVLEQLGPEELDNLVAQAVELLPEPLVRRNPTLSNPFVRGKVYELACGQPLN